MSIPTIFPPDDALTGHVFTRVELITGVGRVHKVFYDVAFQASVQDGGETLKLFAVKKEPKFDTDGWNVAKLVKPPVNAKVLIRWVTHSDPVTTMIWDGTEWLIFGAHMRTTNRLMASYNYGYVPLRETGKTAPKEWRFIPASIR